MNDKKALEGLSGFGERLRRLRVQAELTQGELGKEFGLVASSIGKYERTENSYPSIEILLKLSAFFDVSTDYLLKGVELTPTIANNINGSISNSPFIQANNGGVSLNNGENTLSPEAMELLRIYASLHGRERLKLLNYAVELESGEQK